MAAEVIGPQAAAMDAAMDAAAGALALAGNDLKMVQSGSFGFPSSLFLHVCRNLSKRIT